MAAKEKQILCVGLVCLDIINVVDKFPIEDTDTRCLSQRWQRGGNASNLCTVLSLLGAPCGFMGTLAPGRVSDFVYDDLRRYGIDVTNVIVHAESSFPASIVISNINSGSRTILHTNSVWTIGNGFHRGKEILCDQMHRPVVLYFNFSFTNSQVTPDFPHLSVSCLCHFPWRSFITDDFQSRGVNISNVVWQRVGVTPCACCIVNLSNGSRTVVLSDMNLPNVTSEDFRKIDLSQYKWIHWEGRNASEQVAMIQQVEQYNVTVPAEQRITISVEIEKTREELYQLFGHGDVVFVSKDIARHFGFNSAAEAVKGLYNQLRPGAYLICAWAEKGADAMGPDGVFHSNAFPPEKLVDTLGAGDTFNAAVLFALCNGKSIQEALTFGCQIAGKKCGIQGYDGIV